MLWVYIIKIFIVFLLSKNFLYFYYKNTRYIGLLTLYSFPFQDHAYFNSYELIMIYIMLYYKIK